MNTDLKEPVLPEKTTASPVRPIRTPDPKRFEASKLVLLTDSFMNHFIKVGGVLVVVAVIGIFVFILSQVLPMFKGAKVNLGGSQEMMAQLPEGNYLAIGVDEWGDRPFAIRADGKIFFSDLKAGGKVHEAGFEFLGTDKISALEAVPGSGVIAVGTEQGALHLIDYQYDPVFSGGVRTVQEKLTKAYSGQVEGAVRQIAFGQSSSARLVATMIDGAAAAGPRLLVNLIERKRSLVGTGEWKQTAAIDLTPSLRADSKVKSLHITDRADSMLVVFANGEVDYHFLTDGGQKFELRQTFRPFQDLPDQSVATAGFLLGDVSMVFLSPSGVNRIFSLFATPEEPVRVFHQTKEFTPLVKTSASLADNGYFSKSLRNKAFITGFDNLASLRHATTGKVRWQADLPYSVDHALIGAKYDSLLFLSEDRRFHRHVLVDPHPEVSWQALFGKIWYEGSSEPKYEWQSTGGSDDFEPKLSLIPLIFGSLKGTFYALLFALPVALFGAIYTSEFLHPRNKVLVKPVIEIMASLPSVVLGFLAALWLAPLLESRVPSILCILVLVPTAAFLIGWIWSRQPQSIRKYVPKGREFIYFTPILLVLMALGWHLGPYVEQVLFRVTDSVTGKSIGDFSRWWPVVTNTAYEQRNSLVVGFVMGFAVIPIIFTIAEDSLSNVPGALRSGSLALGASRWQTAWWVVLPTASAGIFSALMIGLGRAVGETMIVVMATGNTPIMEWNIFSGMRTLSANIAVELPEAPHHGTLYRSLFLGAMVLFLMTFTVNTIAEVLRQHLREKYKTI